MNQYEAQTLKFLNDTGTFFSARFIRHRPFFYSETTSRDVFKVTLRRGTKEWQFLFGQSIAKSTKNDKNRPSAYDVLSCITNYDPGTLENFASEYGYGTNSQEAERMRTYEAVKKEWDNVNNLFGDVLEQLRKIQ